MKRLFYWLSAAFSVFVNGCLDGWKGGIGSGVASGGLIHAETTIPEWQKIVVTAGGIAAPMVSHGLTDVAIWRAQHPFPNLFPDPSDSASTPK